MVTTQGDDGIKTYPTKHNWGRKRIGRRYRNNGRVNSRAASRCRGGGDTGFSALTEAVKIFVPAAITQEFSKKLIK